MECFPRTLDDVKQRMAALREARRQKEEQASAAGGAASAAVSASDAPRAAAAAPSTAATSTTSAASLKALREQRERALEVKRSLEHRLGSILWVECARQAQALEFMQRAPPEARSQLRLFACELPAHVRRDGTRPHSGARRFIVSTYADFWTRYFTLAPSARHHYEVVMEHAPCHLYFDIECKWRTNPQLIADAHDDEAARARRARGGDSHLQCAEADRVVEAVCEELVEHINQTFGADIHARVENILQLDSSSSVKFSRHLVVRLSGPPPAATTAAETAEGESGTSLQPSPSASAATSPAPPRWMFRDNAHAGRYVRAFHQHLMRRAMQTNKMAEQNVEDEVSVEDQRSAERARLLQFIFVHEDEATQPATTVADGYDAFGLSADSSTAPAAAAAAAHSASATPTLPKVGPPPPLPSTSSLIDQSVYSRNRSFRLFLSSKNARVPIAQHVQQQMAAQQQQLQQQTQQTGGGGGRSSVVTGVAHMEAAPTLLIADSNRYPLEGLTLKDIFMDSLICNVQCPWNELRLLTFSELDEAAVESTDFLVPLAGGAIGGGGAAEGAHGASGLNANGKRMRASSSGGSAGSGGSASYSSSSSGRRFHPCPSPYPRLEHFLLQHLHTRSPEARIRGWTSYKEQGQANSSSSIASAPGASHVARHTVSFSIDGDRYCANIGRPHRSNGVYYIVDLLAYTLVQRCWDPQCKYFTSPPTMMPRWIADMEREEEEEEAEVEGDEAEGDDASEAKPAEATSQTAPRPSLLDSDDEWDEDALAAVDAAAAAAMSK